MRDARKERRQALTAAILWTVSAAVWSILTVLRAGIPYMDGRLVILTLLAAGANLIACVVWWRRWLRSKQNTTTE